MFFYRLFLWDCASLCVAPPFWAWRRRIHGFRTKATSIDPISLQLFPGSAWVLQQKSSRIQSIHLDGYVGDSSHNHDKCPICQLDCRVTCFLHYHLLHHSPVPYTTGLTMSSDPGNCRLPSASDHAARGCVQRDEPLPGDTISGGNGTFSDWNRRGRSTMFMEVGQNLQMLGIVRFIVIPKMGLAIQHGQIAFRSFKLSKKHQIFVDPFARSMSISLCSMANSPLWGPYPQPLGGYGNIHFHPFPTVPLRKLSSQWSKPPKCDLPIPMNIGLDRPPISCYLWLVCHWSCLGFKFILISRPSSFWKVKKVPMLLLSWKRLTILEMAEGKTDRKPPRIAKATTM